jgi:hypothetical protein
MKIIPLSKKTDWKMDEQEALKTEFRESERFGEIRIGKKNLFYRGFVRVRFLPLAECERIYLRIEFGEYGEFPLHEHYIVVLTKKEEELLLRLERPDDAKNLLSFLEENAKEIKLGKV